MTCLYPSGSWQRFLLIAVIGAAGLPSCGRAVEQSATVVAIVELPHHTTDEVVQSALVPVEQAFEQVEGRRRIRSLARSGRGIVWIELDGQTEPAAARQLMAERLAALAAHLPADAKWSLRIAEPDDGPVVLVALRSQSHPLSLLTRIAESELRGRLTTIPGVTDVEIRGGVREQCRIQVDFDRLQQYGADLQVIVDALAKQGMVADDGRAAPKTEAPLIVDGVKQLGEAIVNVRNGVPLRLPDVATIELAAEKRGTPAAIHEAGLDETTRGADPAVVLMVRFASGRDRAASVRDVAGVLEAAEKNLPADVTLAKRAFEPHDYRVRLRFPAGTSSSSAARHGEFVERMLIEMPDLQALWRLPSDLEPSADDPSIDLYVKFAGEEAASRAVLRKQILQAGREMPEVDLGIGAVRFSRFDDPVDADVVVAVSGIAPAKVKELASKCRFDLSNVKDVVARFDERSVVDVRLELMAEQLAKLGVKAEACRNAFQVATSGLVVGRLASAGGQSIEVVLRSADYARPDALRNAKVPGAGGRMVRITDVANLMMVDQPPYLYRENGRPTAIIECDFLSSDGHDAAVARLNEALQAMEWPEGYAWRIVRDGKEFLRTGN